MKLQVLLLSALFILLAHSAFACSMIIAEWQVTEWWDGTTTYQFLGTEEIQYDCGGGGGGGTPSPSSGGGVPVHTIPPTVIFAQIDTVDPSNPMVAIDVTSNDPNNPVTVVILELNGQTIDYQDWAGNSSYLFRLSPITSFGEGSVTLNGKACAATGDCAESPATMTRFTPSPITASASINASWREEEESGPVTVVASYGHTLSQSYTTTTFTCSEIGEASHVQVKDSLATISGHDPMPVWSASVQTYGTLNSASYYLNDAATPYCAYPLTCSSKGGSSGGSLGYAPSVHESISSFAVDGWPAAITNAYLDVSFP